MKFHEFAESLKLRPSFNGWLTPKDEFIRGDIEGAPFDLFSEGYVHVDINFTKTPLKPIKAECGLTTGIMILTGPEDRLVRSGFYLEPIAVEFSLRIQPNLV